MLALATLLAIPFLSGAAGDIPDISVPPQMLRTMSAQELGTLLLGKDAPRFVDAWVEGPTVQFDAITVDLASAPRTTRYAGLCEADFTNAYFRWPAGKRGELVPAGLGMTPYLRTQFMVTSDEPDLRVANVPAQACSVSNNLVGYAAYASTAVFFHPGGNAALKAGTPEMARFAFAAFLSARETKTATARAERCHAGYVDIPALCNDPAAFIRSTYLRHVDSLLVKPCDGVTLCVDVAVTPDRGGHHILITTDRETTELRERARPGVKSIVVRAGPDPIS
jgi:hypothetical protein